MKRAFREAGFALPVALVIITIASLLAVTCVTMVLGAGRITASDARARRAYEVARAGLTDVCERLRWSWPMAATGAPVALDDELWYETEITPLPVETDTRPHLVIKIVGHAGSTASKPLTTEVVIDPDALPAGLTVAGDVEACAPVAIVGSGLYAGGDVFGRQFVTFARAGDTGSVTPPPDWVQGDRFAAAAVHALGVICDEGGEVHDSGRDPAAVPADTDSHTPLAPRPLIDEPDELTLTTLGAHSLSSGGVVRDGVVDVGRLPYQPPSGDASQPGNGIVVVVSAGGSDEAVRLVGSRPSPPEACPLTVVVIGNATTTAVDQTSEPVTWWGALIVTGGLVVASPLDMHGSLFARHLTVVAPLNLELGETWWRDPPPGYRRAIVVARDW